MQKDVSPLISVIIPVYNSSKYLYKCLDSVAKQTFKDFEVIVIDDGSTDDSSDIINKFVNKYDNFIFKKQENKGAAIARNMGIDIARGKFISFIDSDDFVEKDFLEVMYNKAIENNSDVVCCGFSYYHPNSNKFIKDIFMINSGVYSSNKILSLMIKDFRMHYYMWNKLWKRDLFENNNIRYPQICFEDITTVPKLVYFSNKVTVIKKSYYYYTNNKNSLVHTVNISQLNDYIKSLAMLRCFLEQENIYDKFKLSFMLYSYRTIICNLKSIFVIYKNKKNFKGMFKTIKLANNAVLNCIKKNFVCDESKLNDFIGLI